MNVPGLHLDPRFLADADALFTRLRDGVTWDERMKARRTASFGVPYDYSQIAYPPAPMPPALDALCARIEAALGFRPNNCLLNFYADGLASMGFHSDSAQDLREGTGVAIVSLGATRPIVFRSKADKSVEHAIDLNAGSLLFMTQAVQDAWLHAIPRQESAGERISVTFRCVVDARE